jgi:Prolipoprotein diacylglyceryl transferase
VVGILLWVGARRRLRPGSLALLYLILYGAGRFLLELLRTDTTYRLFGLSRNAYVSLAVVVGGSVWLYLRERRRPPAEEAEPAAPEEPEPAAAEAAEATPPGAASAAGDAEPPAGAGEAVAARGEEARSGEAGEAAGGDEDQTREEAPAGGRDEGGARGS